MSQLQKMIQRLCSNGVEFKKLGQICRTITTGKLNANAMVKNGKYPFFTCDAQPSQIDTYAYDTEAILISGNGSSIGHINYYKGKFNAYQRTYILANFNSTINIFFLFYHLKCKFKQYIMFKSKKGAVPYITLPILQNFEIPVPPLEVQNEIVRILDAFTSHTAELQAELQARKEQYEYYRNKLLSFDKNDENVKWMRLEEICFYPRERISTSLLHKNNYVGVENLLPDKQGKTESNYVPTNGYCIAYAINDILIGNIRPYLKKIWIANNNGGTNGDVLIFRLKEEYLNSIKSKYLYYLLSSDSFFHYNNKYAKGAKMPRGNKNMNMKYIVPIPSLSEQQRIVSILDKFETLVNDLIGGIPAEIAAVQEQYEYYRNKLLSFPKLEA